MRERKRERQKSFQIKMCINLPIQPLLEVSHADADDVLLLGLQVGNKDVVVESLHTTLDENNGDQL